MADDIFQKILAQLKTITTKLTGDTGNNTGSGQGGGKGKGVSALFNGLRKALPAIANGGGKAAAFARIALVAAKVATVFGLIVVAGLALAKAIGSIFTKIKENGEKLINQMREYALFNAKTAAAFARYDYEELLRKRRFAEATAESTKSLLEAQSRLKDAMLPWEAAMQNLRNNFQSAVADFTAGFLDSTNEFFEGFSGLFGSVDNPAGEENWGEMIYDGIQELIGIEDAVRNEEKQRAADDKARREKEKNPNWFIKELFEKVNKGDTNFRQRKIPLFNWNG